MAGLPRCQMNMHEGQLHIAYDRLGSPLIGDVLFMHVLVKVGLQVGKLCQRLHVTLALQRKLAFEVLHREICLCQLYLGIYKVVQELPL